MATPELHAGVSPLKLIANDPPDFGPLERVIPSAEDLRFVWPDAAYPLELAAWHEWMARYPDARSYYVELDGETVGHGAIFGTGDPKRAHIAWVYLAPGVRGAGRGQELIAILEAKAAARAGCRRISLRTNDFNPRAYHIYAKRGFRETGRRGDLIEMVKELEG